MMTNAETIRAACAAFANNDPSVLFGAMAPGIWWNEAPGNPTDTEQWARLMPEQ